MAVEDGNWICFPMILERSCYNLSTSSICLKDKLSTCKYFIKYNLSPKALKLICRSFALSCHRFESLKLQKISGPCCQERAGKEDGARTEPDFPSGAEFRMT